MSGGLRERLRTWARQRRLQRDAEWAARTATAQGRPWPRRIVYLSPDSSKPIGGVKVIYQHVETLRRLGVDAHVMHESPNFRCRWFDSDAPVLHWRQLRHGDEAVVPEVMPQAATRLQLRGVPYLMFVQNVYLLLEGADAAAMRTIYGHARAVLSISDDGSEVLRRWMPALAGRLFRVQPRVDAARFAPSAKERLVTYMPRKMPQHARLVARWLADAHPDWRFQALDGITEAAVAEALQRSRLFLAFGEHEGFGLPPVEAALAGNLVLGYHGQGGREYFEPPLFHPVAVGDLPALVSGFAHLAGPTATPQPPAIWSPAHEAARLALAQTYGPAREEACLRAVAERLGWLSSLTPHGAPSAGLG